MPPVHVWFETPRPGSTQFSNEITYSLDGYNSYCNSGKEMAGGGCMLYIHSIVSAIQLSSATTTNDVFNVCTVLLDC